MSTQFIHSKKYYRTKLPELPASVKVPKKLLSASEVCKKRKRISEYICRNIRTARLASLDRSDVATHSGRPTTSKDIKLFTECCPITDMSRFQEKRIRQKINAKGLEKLYPQLLNDFMKETKLEYRKVTQNAGINLKVKDKSLDQFTVTGYKFLGRTNRYDLFLCIRKQLSIRWVLHYPIMRQFLVNCETNLPHSLFNIDISKVVDIEELQRIFKEKIFYASCTLQDFHKSVSKLLDQKSTAVKVLKLLRACTGLLSKYISKCIANTMTNIATFTQIREKPPYLKLHVDFTSKLVVYPKEEEVVELFYTLLDDLIGIGEELGAMERGRVKGCETKKIWLCLTEEFVQKCKNQVKDNIEVLYHPVEQYLTNLEKEFVIVYSDITCHLVGQVSDVLFEEGCQKIDFYRQYISKVTVIPDNEYFNIGQLDLTLYREKVHSKLSEIADSIFNNLSAQHLWEVNDICDTFQLIKTRAYQKPSTTEELIEIGKFMAWIRNEHLDELNSRVCEALRSLSQLITVGILDSHHISRNSEAINWTENIIPIIETYSITFEQLKFEAEDTLQRVIEEINVLITSTYPLLVILDEMDDIKLARSYLNKITLHMAKIKEIQLQIEWINKEEVCLNFPKSSYPAFDNLKDYVYPFYHLLKLSLDVQKHVSVWQHGQFDLLDSTKASERVESFSEELEDVKKLYRKKLRQAQDENLAIRFKGTVDDPDILNWPAPLKLCGMSLNVLEEFKPSLIVMQIMCNKALRPRHWKAMSEIAGFNLMPNAGTTLKKMVNYNLQDKLKEFEIISVCATKEEDLLQHLNQLKSQWDCVTFTVKQTENKQLILDNLNDIQAIADQDNVEIFKMFSSVFVRPFVDDVKSFLNMITHIQNVLIDWTVFQKVYLEFQQVMLSVNELSILKNQFLTCQNVYNQYINLMKKETKVVEVVHNTNIAEDVKVSLAVLEQVQKGVDNYLEEVRMKFPRLFLISDQELIELVPFKGCPSNIFQKTFPGLNHLKLDATNLKVTAVCSKYGEELNLKNPVNVTDKVEELFRNLDLEIVKSVKHKTAECYKIFKKTPIKDLLKKYPEQAIQVITKVFWTDNAEIGLKLPHNIKLLLLKKKLMNNIQDKISEIRSGQLNHLHTKIFKNLLLVDLNLKYLLDSLMIDGKVINHEHFDWQRQLKYYLQESVCTVKFLDYSIDYGYEYLGNQQTAVITPQTERCCITLLLAYLSGFHGFLKGQSGKSVTAKSLAMMLGFFYVNFTCLSTLTSECLRKIIKGVVMTGCWLGLKKIERLKEEVMSSITQELGNILECKNEVKNCEITFNSRSFVVAQMTSKVNLPENFKLLFRTFTMSQPNLEVIIESLLTIEGVEQPKECSERLCSTLELLQDVIGVEIQSQFNLKQVKQVLRQLQRVKLEQPEIHPLKALALSIRDVYQPGLSHQNQKLLKQTLKDVFQDCYPLTEPLCTLKLHCDYTVTTNYTNKIEQVYQTLKRKKTLILLGDTYTGKSTILKLCSQLCQQVSLHIFNPKTITYPDLIEKRSGNPNLKWTDGVLLKILKQSNGNPSKWILFDGNVEEEWCKDLVELLGDKELLLETLQESKLQEDVNFVFECTSLEKCSPALISRCTTVYFPPDTLHYESIINTRLNMWKSDLKIDHQEHIASLFKWFIPACLKTVQNLEVPFDLHENVIVKNVLTYFQLLLDEAHANNCHSKKEEDLKNHPTWIHASLIHAGVLGFSSFMSCNSIMKFDEFYKQLWKGVHPKYPYPKFMDKLEVGIPTDGLLLDHFYLYKQRGTWKLWSDLLKNEKIVESDYLNGWIVPTVDNMRCNFFLDLHMKYNQKLVIVAAKNSGKSLTLQQCYLSNLEECSFITMSRHLSAKKFQNILLRKLNKVSTSRYRPQGKNCICFLDDLHLNSLDSNELLRQHLDHHVWYDLNNWTEISLEGVVFMAAATTSINNNVCKRVLKHFNVFGLNTLTDEGMSRIYSQSLSHTWKKSGFPGDVLSAVDQIVDILLQVYQNLKVALKPSLIKPHYRFDLKSFAKVIQGCTYLKKETYDNNKKVYLKVFVHEMIRVFTDPLTPEDTSVALGTIKKLVEENLPEDASEFFTNDWDKMFFSRYLAKNINCYEEMSWQILKDGCEHHLQDFNRTYSFKLDLIFFDYALEQVAKLCRLIHVPSEHCILFGTTGSGRQSLSKFSAYLSQMNFAQPAFSSQNLTEDLKRILKQCGGLNQKTVFFLSEDQLQSDDNIFQVIDHYLRDGDITDLFNSHEQQDILELTRLAAQGGNKNLDITAHKVFLYFNKMCRQNLHLILSLDLQSPKLRRRIADYPTLVSRISPIYWPVWPDTALQCVAENFLSNIPLDNQIKVAEVAVKIYKTFPSTTPKKFWHFNTLFVNLITRKQQELKLQREKFQKGLDKLSYAANQILNMQKVLAEYQPLLEDMTKNAIKMTEQIALETSEVEKASALVRTDEKIAHNQAAVAQVLKSECESELAQAIPILEDAISALNTLKPSDITLVKSMKNPPDAIKLVMASVCVIKEVKPDKIPDASTGRKTLDFWGPSKRILGDMNFLQSLKDFDKDHIKPEIIAKIRKEYLPHKDFKPSVVAKASSAAEGLCKWIIAMDMYDKVAKEVAPKKVKLDKAEREYAETMKVLNEKKEEVVRIEEKLAQLKALLEEATKKQEKLQHEVDLCNIKLESAQNLIGGLSGDKQRWTEASEYIQKCYENLAGDMLLCSALVAYAAEIHQEARNVNISKCRKYINEFEIPATNQEEFKFTSSLTVPAEMESWLPNNNFFIENFLIYFNSRHFSIFNDPHGQAAQWLLNSENGNSLVVTKFTYNDWLPKFKLTISSGGRILIKDTTGHLPTSLKQFLCGYTRVEPDGTVYVTINQEELLVHRNSKVYIVSCKPNCCYSPDIYSKVTVINFSLTVQILEDDLLKTLVEIEKPEIRRKTLRLVETNRENNALIQQLELKILDTLCESQVDILEDVASISILDKSKELSKVALEKQNESRLIAEEIDDFKQDYLQVAKYVAKLFFSIKALQKLHSKYQYSLKWFKEVYFMSILNSGKSKVVETRCVNICQAFSFDLFKHVSRGLFEKHKLLFTFSMALHSTNKPAEDFFAAENLETKPFWITDEQWQDLLGGTCAIHTLSVTPYQQLLLTKTFKPENLIQQIGLFIKQVLGETFLKPRFFNMQDTYNDSNSLMPITFILTPNLNVLESLQSFAKIKQVLHKFHYLSLDGFNSNRAEDLIKHCQKEGSWVLLQNCQYTGKWLFQLERHLESLDFENTHENFRLFLTTEAEHEFPLEVIQSCVKIINEPSTKMKENLMETYTKPPVAVDDYYYSCPSQQIVFSRLLYRLCCFHFVLKARKVIEASKSDLHWSLHFLKTFISDEGNLFHKVDYIIGHCIYNCYLESQEDKLLLSKLLQGYVNLSVITDKSLALKYVPTKKDRRDYLVYISNLPEETLPGTLYLTQQQLLNQQLLQTSEFLKNGVTLSGCCTRTNQLNPKDLVEDLLNVLPSNFIGDPKTPGHIQRELLLYQTLLKTIKTTLVNLSTSLEDGEFFPEDLEHLLQDLTKHKVPKMWLKLCYPTLANLGTFMSHLNENVQFINRYATKVPVLLRALYFPRVILSLAKLDFVSKNKTKIEDVGFVYKVSDEVKIEEGEVVIEGLVLNGASYSQIEDRIVDLPPKTWCTQMPLVGFEAVSQVKRTEPTCPVQIFKTTPSEINDGFRYGTSNFVTTVRLKCSKSEDFWIKRGVIILCENLLGLEM